MGYDHGFEQRGRLHVIDDYISDANPPLIKMRPVDWAGFLARTGTTPNSLYQGDFDCIFVDKLHIKVPSRTSLTNYLENHARLFHQWLAAKISEEASAGYSMTLDGWTNAQQEHFLGVTLHYLTDEFRRKDIVWDLIRCEGKSEELFDGLTKSLKTLNVPLLSVTADSGSNMLALIERILNAKEFQTPARVFPIEHIR